MQVTKNITLDLLETGSPVIIKAKQNDRNTRYIAAHLYVDGLAYPVPSGTEIAFRYKKPDGTAGFYDALPDNSPAITVSGNTVTVELVEQVLTAAGCVHCEINMYNAASEKLTTFTFEISVEESVLTDAEIISSDYYNVLTAEIAKALQAVTDATEQAENAAQSAQDAADSAAMSKDWAAGQPVTYSGTPVSIAYAGAQRIASITAYGETPQGGTTEAPVALTGVDSVQVCGRNLLPNKATTKTVAGITHTVNPDKSVTAKGTASSWSNIVIDADFSLPAGTYTLNSNMQAAGVNLVIGKDTSGTKNIAVSATTSKTFELSAPIKHCVAYIAVAPDSVVDTTIYPMLNLGTSALPYETYQGSVTQLPIPRPLRKVGDVRDVCRTRVKSVYDKWIVLDGTENWNISSSKPNSFLTAVSERIMNGLSDSYPTLKSPEIGTKNGIYLIYTEDIIVTDLACSTVEEFKAHLSAHPLTVYYQSTAYDDTNGLDVCLTEYQTGYIESYADESITTAWISSTGELSTGAEVAYVLSSPETYATDPVDFDNAAGPLTVMTGGELEVRMTELVGTRSDVSNNTVAFTETAQDTDIASGEKLSVLFGKIKKRFSVVNKLVNGAVYPNLLDNSDFTNPVNQRGSTSYSGGGTYCIDRWDIASTATVAVVSDGIKITATTLSGIRQKIENITDGQLLVFQLCDNADTVYTQAFAASTTQAEYTTDFGKFRFVLNSGGVLTISILLNAGERTFKWAKLEKGSVATPYVPKGYGAELAECLRYFQRVHADWRIYPTLKDMLYRFSQSTLQVMRIKPTISAHGTPYTFGCTINALDAQPMAFTVETKITEQGQNSAAASMLGYFDLSADL